MTYSSNAPELAKQLLSEHPESKKMAATGDAQAGGGLFSIITTWIAFLQAQGWDLTKIVDFIKTVIGLFHKTAATDPSKPILP